MKKIIVAGATGNLGARIVKALTSRGADVISLVRVDTDVAKVRTLQDLGSKIARIDQGNTDQIAEAASGAACAISALQGLRDVIIDAQKAILDAAVKAGIPRFIPSDFASDFTKQPEGENRNFDLRREFYRALDHASIRATSIFNGAFGEILTYNVPVFDCKNKTIGYWDDPDWRVDYTTMDDTAAYTAAAALDDTTPRALHIASFQVSANDLQQWTARSLPTPFRLVNLGTREDLAERNRRDRAAQPEGETQLYASWQQGQYMQSMFATHHDSLDNARYPDLHWTRLEEVVHFPPEQSKQAAQ